LFCSPDIDYAIIDPSRYAATVHGVISRCAIGALCSVALDAALYVAGLAKVCSGIEEKAGKADLASCAVEAFGTVLPALTDAGLCISV
jgi:hypothetical protein